MGTEKEALLTVACNAIRTVILNGRAVDGEHRPLVFRWAVGVRNPRLLVPPIVAATEDTRPPLPPLPPAGDLMLSLSLGLQLGYGRSGIVYEATVNCEGTSPHLLSSLPPMVVKLSYRGQRAGLAHDAYYYDFMRAIQGVSIPRCYGHFGARVPASTHLVHSPAGDDEPAIIDNTPQRPYEGVQKTLNPQIELGEPIDSDVEELEEIPDYISILVLERLGGYLPIGEPLPESLIKDVNDIYDDLAHMRVWTDDIRYTNILRAPLSPPGIPGLVCPFHNYVHEWRLVDFEHARETNLSLQRHAWCTSGWLQDQILDHLPSGFYLDPEVESV